LLLLILLVAALLRLWQLDSVPPGLTHDEANNVYDAAAVLDGVRPAYFPVAQGKEPLYPYSAALLMAVLGPSAWVMRLTSALWGLALVVLGYAWVRRAFGPVIALLTAAWLAVSFWPVTTSRMGLRAITLPVLFTAAVYFLWRGGDKWTNGQMNKSASRRKSVLFYILAGLALGGSLYTYLAARLMLLVLGVFFVYLLSHRKVAWGILLSLIVAALVAAPLLLYLDAHPSAEIRIGQLDRPLRELLEGKPGLLLDRAGSTLLMFSFRGDTFIPYNLPGKPLLDPLTSLLFYAGLALALWRWRQPAYTLALLWLVVGFGPALATGVQAANLRAIAAQPIVYLFPALSLHATGHAIHARLRHARHSPVLRLSAFVLLTAIAALTYRDYFIRWSDDRDVRVHCHVDLIAIARYARQHPDQTFVVSALYPGQYHDPRVVQAELEGDDQHLRWMDGRGAIVLPANDGMAVLPAAERIIAFIVPASVPLDPALQAILAPDLQHVERVTVRPDDFNPTFDVYHWQGRATPVHRPVAQVGVRLRLLKADLLTTPARPGDSVELVTTWHIDTPLPADREAVLFTQVLDAQGNVVAQQDRLDAPSWNWHPGDQFIQLHRLSLPADLPPGDYRLITGLYTVPDRVDAVLAGHEPDPATPRLPILKDGTPIRDYIELPPLEVVANE
jgi:4-amino-4-deoxy-L-arabinose transferase-like glycosyltransferase